MVSSSTVAAPSPVRTCVGCRERATKSELMRVVAGSDAHGQPVVALDPKAIAAGRGAHLHPTVRCFDLAVRKRAFGRALRSGGGLATTSLGEQIASLFDRDTQDHFEVPPTRDWSSSS